MLGWRPRDNGVMGRRNGCGAGGLHVVKLVQYKVCGLAMAVGGVQYTSEKLENRASEWWWGMSTFLFFARTNNLSEVTFGVRSPRKQVCPA